MFLLDSSGFFADICNNITDFVKAVGSYIVIIVGILCLLAAVLQLVKAFAAKGRANWLPIILCFLLGGLLAFTGWSMITGGTLSTLGKDTLEAAAGGATPDATPDAVGELNTGAFVTGSVGSDTLSKTSSGVTVIANAFLLPFAKALAVCVGVILVIMGAWMVAKHYITSGKAPISWSKMLMFVILGSVLFTGTSNSTDPDGWTYLRDKLIGGSRDAITSAIDETATEGDGLTPPNSFGSNPADIP